MYESELDYLVAAAHARFRGSGGVLAPVLTGAERPRDLLRRGVRPEHLPPPLDDVYDAILGQDIERADAHAVIGELRRRGIPGAVAIVDDVALCAIGDWREYRRRRL